MSLNSSDRKYTHISIDSYPIIKPIGYLGNEYEDRDSGDPFVVFELEEQQNTIKPKSSRLSYREHAEYCKKLVLEEISKIDDDLKNCPSPRNSTSTSSSHGLNSRSLCHRKGDERRVPYPSFYFPKITTSQDLVSIGNKYHMSNVILDYPNKDESTALPLELTLPSMKSHSESDFDSQFIIFP